MKSICLYSSYFEDKELPYYIRFYLDSLTSHFTEMVFITNEKELNKDSLDFLKSKNIELMYVKNEGWDFGMWYKAMQVKDVLSYDRVGLINDSCILFKKPTEFFDWLEKTDLDYCGMVDSNAINYHIQSYFVIINKKAIPAVSEYFKKQGMLNDLDSVIRTYEVGLTQHLIDLGFKTGACYSTKEYKGEYSPLFLMAKELIEKGLPLIKKKIVFCSFREDEYLNLIRMKFDLDPRTYITFIKLKLATEKVVGIEFGRVQMSYDAAFFRKLRKYDLKYMFYQFARKFKPKRS